MKKSHHHVFSTFLALHASQENENRSRNMEAYHFTP